MPILEQLMVLVNLLTHFNIPKNHDFGKYKFRAGNQSIFGIDMALKTLK
jgi:hypothetical protein